MNSVWLHLAHAGLLLPVVLGHGGHGVQLGLAHNLHRVQYSTVQYSTVQYSTVQYSTALAHHLDRVEPRGHAGGSRQHVLEHWHAAGEGGYIAEYRTLELSMKCREIFTISQEDPNY